MSFVAVAVGVTGVMSGFMAYQGQKAAAEAQAQQAKVNAQAKQAQRELDSKAEMAEVQQMRDKARRNRASIESAYAASGVLLDGTAADVLTKQREIDELNVQNRHVAGANQRNLNVWGANENFKQQMYGADTSKRLAGMSLLTSTASSVAAGFNAWNPTQGTMTTRATTSAGSAFPTQSFAAMPSQSIGQPMKSVWGGI